jgi:hypothetical protein
MAEPTTLAARNEGGRPSSDRVRSGSLPVLLLATLMIGSADASRDRRHPDPADPETRP